MSSHAASAEAQLAGLLEAATACTSRNEFRRAALTWIDRNVGIDIGYFGPMSPQSGDRAVISGFDQRFVDRFHERGPSYESDVLRMLGPALRQGISRDSEAMPDLDRTVFYQDLLHPLGFEPVGGLSLALTIAGQPTAMVQLARSDPRRPVGEQAFELLRRAVPVLALGDGLQRPVSPAAPATHDSGGSLTRREREVVQYAVLGLTNGEIALACGTSPHTVKNQLAAIFRKLTVGSRAELVSVALAEGLIDQQGLRR